MRKPKKPATVRLEVVVPHIEGLTVAQHRQSVRDALRQTGDFYRRTVRVRSVAAASKEVRKP